MDTTITADKYAGCILGLALGDALGAPYEGGPLERLAWKILGRTSQGLRRYTDDTQMSVDIAESVVARKSIDLDDIAQRFAQSYRWTRGYGRGAAKTLKKIRSGVPWDRANKLAFRDGSFGNGAAMRSPVVALNSPANIEAVVENAHALGQITHAHPLGLEGASLVAVATAVSLSDSQPMRAFEIAAAQCASALFVEKVEIARAWLLSDAEPTPREVASRLGNGIAAADSCVTAVYLTTRFKARSFRELIDFSIGCGGDVDTISAMAGAIWGASNGASALPGDDLDTIEGYEHINHLAHEVHGLVMGC